VRARQADRRADTRRRPGGDRQRDGGRTRPVDPAAPRAGGSVCGRERPRRGHLRLVGGARHSDDSVHRPGVATPTRRNRHSDRRGGCADRRCARNGTGPRTDVDGNTDRGVHLGDVAPSATSLAPADCRLLHCDSRTSGGRAEHPGAGRTSRGRSAAAGRFLDRRAADRGNSGRDPQGVSLGPRGPGACARTRA